MRQHSLQNSQEATGACKQLYSVHNDLLRAAQCGRREKQSLGLRCSLDKSFLQTADGSPTRVQALQAVNNLKRQKMTERGRAREYRRTGEHRDRQSRRSKEKGGGCHNHGATDSVGAPPSFDWLGKAFREKSLTARPSAV